MQKSSWGFVKTHAYAQTRIHNIQTHIQRYAQYTDTHAKLHIRTEHPLKFTQNVHIDTPTTRDAHRQSQTHTHNYIHNFRRDMHISSKIQNKN